MHQVGYWQEIGKNLFYCTVHTCLCCFQTLIIEVTVMQFLPFPLHSCHLKNYCDCHTLCGICHCSIYFTRRKQVVCILLILCAMGWMYLVKRDAGWEVQKIHRKGSIVGFIVCHLYDMSSFEYGSSSFKNSTICAVNTAISLPAFCFLFTENWLSSPQWIFTHTSDRAISSLQSGVAQELRLLGCASVLEVE